MRRFTIIRIFTEAARRLRTFTDAAVLLSASQEI